MAYQIFEMSDGQRVALYAQGNSVLYCLLPFARGMLPIEVKRDYLAHFEARVFRDTVCYVYETWSIRLYWIRWETALRGSFLRTDRLGTDSAICIW